MKLTERFPIETFQGRPSKALVLSAKAGEIAAMEMTAMAERRILNPTIFTVRVQQFAGFSELSLRIAVSIHRRPKFIKPHRIPKVGDKFHVNRGRDLDTEVRRAESLGSAPEKTGFRVSLRN